MARFRRCAAAAFAACLFGLGSPLLAKLPGFDSALAAYNNRDYAGALAQFQNISRSNPNDASAHYYMGLCYQYLSQMTSAKQEYNWVYNYSADQSLRYNSYQALQQIQKWGSHRSYSGQGNNFQAANQVTRAARRTAPTAVVPEEDQSQTGGKT